jgi:hypothetical protein
VYCVTARQSKEAASFSEEKEAKRLLFSDV